MAYTKHEWTDGEVITKENLNNMENGIKSVDTTATNKQIKTVVINTNESDVITGGLITFNDDTTVAITVNKTGG